MEEQYTQHFTRDVEDFQQNQDTDKLVKQMYLLRMHNLRMYAFAHQALPIGPEWELLLNHLYDDEIKDSREYGHISIDTTKTIFDDAFINDIGLAFNIDLRNVIINHLT